MDSDYRRSIKRIEDSEEARAQILGAGLARQFQPVVDRELAQLIDLIATSLKDRRRSRAVRTALIPMKPPGIADRLFRAGLSLSLGDRYGTDKDGNKTYIEQALWIGANFGLSSEAGYRVGDWGLKLLDQLDRFQLEKDKQGEDRLCLIVDDDLEALLKATIVNAAEHNPLLKPLPYRPRPWTGFRAGCLSPQHWAKVQLVRTNHESTENIIRHAIATGQMQPVLDAVSFLQAVPLVINRPILDLVKRVGPPAPLNDAEINCKIEQKKARHKKRTKKAIQAEIVREHRAEHEDWQLDIALAEWSANRDRVRVGLKFDFRGRLIPLCGLSVYRSDRVRALFQFADGEVITPEGVQWLKQFVARLADGNTFSDEPKPSRLDLDGRIVWTERNLAKIVEIGTDIFYGGKPDLDGIDDKFQFAAACAELAGVIEASGDGSDFTTRLPIQFDASCSGLQHLCAAVRAEEGRYVNLTPLARDHFGNIDDQADIYTLIARELALRHPRFGDLKEADQRRVVKQPIMTLFYGAGDRKRAEQIAERYQFDTKALAKDIREVLTAIAPRAMALFEWIQKLVEECSKREHNVPLRLTTATGFIVIGNYYWSNTKKIKTATKNPKHFRNLNFAIGYSDRIKQYKADIAAAANVVHAIDACLLQMVANACAAIGFPLLTIHDCFSTLANHAGQLKRILDERFIKVHEYDWLDNLYQSADKALPKSAELPPVPPRGTLEIAPNFHAFS